MKHESLTVNIDNPFMVSPIVVDMTKHTGFHDNVIQLTRVELRRVKEAVDMETPPQDRPVDSSFVIGLICNSRLPQINAPFKMAYHALSNNEGFGVGTVVDFGFIDTVTPIEELVVTEDAYYFDTSEGSWRLKKLTLGN